MLKTQFLMFAMLFPFSYYLFSVFRCTDYESNANYSWRNTARLLFDAGQTNCISHIRPQQLVDAFKT